MASPASIVKLPSRGVPAAQVEEPPSQGGGSYQPFLPYWAVLENDFFQVLYSWVFRLWVLVMVAAGTGFLLYRVGVYKVTGVVQHASHFLADLTQWTVLVSVALLSVLATHLALGLVGLTAAKMFLHEDIHLVGGLAALGISAAMLAVVVSLGVMVSAMIVNSFAAIAVLWVLLYGGGMLLSSLPVGTPSPDWALQQLPYVLKGQFHLEVLHRVVGWSLGISIGSAFIGMTYFSRRDM